MREMRTGRLAALAVMVAVLLPASPAAAQMVSEARELAVGQAVARNFEKRPGFAENKACAEQILPIRDALVPHSGRLHLPYRVHILKLQEPNAAAVPGFVFVTNGMCQAGLSNHEWAFLLAHEIGHIAGKHTA
ncbi:MAG: M48 family metalloprotease [Armatimonadetes bacterium]|nr:M48 family metalloprotease [Armatimonadota bacterium]